MGKAIHRVITRGVQELCLSAAILDSLFHKAEELLPKSKFLSFEPKGAQTEISDGDSRGLGTLQISLPTKLWMIFDDFGDYYAATALLPREY